LAPRRLPNRNAAIRELLAYAPQREARQASEGAAAWLTTSQPRRCAEQIARATQATLDRIDARLERIERNMGEDFRFLVRLHMAQFAASPLASSCCWA
jgi:hypothetical protein